MLVKILNQKFLEIKKVVIDKSKEIEFDDNDFLRNFLKSTEVVKKLKIMYVMIIFFYK